MSSNKRGNIFDQGRPENPYDDRDEVADVPQKATAAQLAARKIKTAKARRPAGATSGLSQSANFGAPQQNAFGFGASTPAPASNGANGFGGGNAFGGGATNSFPPAQSAAPSNNFAASSFPAFGGSNQGTGFNPTPPSSAGFNFTAGGANPFATANSGPATNGSTPAPAFGGSSMFGNNDQAQSNPFGGLGQNNTTSAASSGGMFGTTSSAPTGGMFGSSSAAPTGGMFGTSSAAPSSGGMFGTSTAASSGGMFGTSSAATSGGMFGTSSAAPGGMFGTTSGAPNATSTAAPASTPFTFGAATTTASNTASTPATSGIFSGFGNSTQSTAPSQPSTFGGFGAGAQKEDASKQAAAPQNNMFGGFGPNAQKPEGTSETPKQNNFFGGLGTSAQGTPNATATAPASNLFNFGANAQKSDSTTSSAPPTNLFGSAPSSNPFANLPTAENTSSGTAAPTNLFSSLKKPEESGSSLSADTPKSNPFAALPKPADTPTTTGSSSGFSIFGANKDAGAATVKAPEAPKSSLFQPFSTPQPAKTADVEKSQGGMFTAAQPKTSSGLFSQTFQPENNNSSNLFKKPQSSFPSASTSASETPKAAPEASNPFASLPKPSTDRPNLFSASKEPSQPSPAPATSIFNSTTSESRGESQAPEMPKVPKVHVPKDWAVPGAVRAQSSDGLLKQISDLTAQLQMLNEKYRQQLSNLPPTADWSSVSLWHYQHAVDIKKKIDNVKKQRAAGRGITGNESSLSTKRKVNDDSHEVRDPSPSKRARATEASAGPTPQLSASTPKLSAPATATSNMFAKAIGNKPSTPAPASSTSLFAPKTAEKSTTEPSQPAASTPGFGFKPSVPTTNGAETSAASSGFKPSFGASSTSTSGSAGFKPNFGSAPAGGFMAQFTKTAKTYEELAAERKRKAMDEDYDSDDETKEEWSARYDKAEAERLAKEKEIAASTKFVIPGSSGSTSPKENPFTGLLKPKSGVSTPKAPSPAPSTGSQSVFNASTSQASSPNIFGHLSGPSSSNQEESDDDDQQQDNAGSAEPPSPPKRSVDASETESEDTQQHNQQESSSKGSLFSRITRDNDSEAEKENSGASSLFGQSNGTTTPSNKPFQFFDFGAASKTAPPKTDTFAGDQTFKVGTPIKFGGAPATEKKDTAPKFNFQPATPGAGEFSTTPAKPPPSSIFNFAPSTGGSSLFAPSGGNSVTSSVFSSRANTPLSEAGDTSAASAAEDDEEGGKQEQIDLTKLTEDELNTYDIVFHTEVVLAKHQEGEKGWTNIAKGPLWILKDKQTGKCSVRVRIPSGATPVNYQILPALPATVTGGSKKMVMATKPAKEGGLQSVLYAVKTPEIAQELAAKYTECVPKSQ
ncbi:hypothetical protein J4E80_009517 [Alternaria sp. BMP 0032]|nr:hypothetical protein J4E80_009517 [Alternaria sp. BMP 0032]